MNLLRKLIMLLTLIAAPLVLIGQPASPSLTLKPGPYLLLDDLLIEQSSNVTRAINCPMRNFDHPVVTAKEDQNFQPYVTVLRDPETRKFRIWYGVPVNAGQSHLAH